MTGDDHRAGDGYDQPRVPDPLRERVDELFVAQRGYDPASFQEALSLVVDLAATASEDEGTEVGGTASAVDSNSASSNAPEADAGDTGSTDPSTSGPAAPSDAVNDDEEPDTEATDGSLESPSLDADDEASVSFDTYVEGLEETREDPSPAVESILDTEHADGVVRELAAEVLDEMTQEAFQELEHGVDQGVAGVTDGMGGAQTADGGATAPSGTTGDGVPDSLTADPESDCAVCGRAHRVSVLQTTILEEDGSVVLVCPSCAE